jgi:phosphoglycerate dehydrogenase-like enzyme
VEALRGAEVLVLSPSFGRWSPAPGAVLAAAGVTVRRPSVVGPLTAEQVRAELGDADAVIVSLDQVDAAALAAAPRLRVVGKHGVGVDNIDVAAAAERGITVVNVPGANGDAVADLVLGQMLNLVRRIPAADASVRRGEWTTFHGPELAELTLGLVGLGRIGRAVARRAAGFAMAVRAVDPCAPPEAFEGVLRAESLTELLATSDVVSLHLPGGQGAPVIGAAELDLLGDGGYLLNAARGDLVDEHAVAAALHAGTLRGYAADAFAVEPPTGSPLLDAPNTLLTPHIGAYTSRANERMGVSVARDVLAVLAGREPAHPVAPVGVPA